VLFRPNFFAAKCRQVTLVFAFVKKVCRLAHSFSPRRHGTPRYRFMPNVPQQYGFPRKPSRMLFRRTSSAAAAQ
jgi:hypothetical protein